MLQASAESTPTLFTLSSVAIATAYSMSFCRTGLVSPPLAPCAPIEPQSMAPLGGGEPGTRMLDVQVGSVVSVAAVPLLPAVEVPEVPEVPPASVAAPPASAPAVAASV